MTDRRGLFRDDDGRFRVIEAADGRRLVIGRNVPSHIVERRLADGGGDLAASVGADLAAEACAAVIAVTRFGFSSWSGPHPTPNPEAWLYVFDIPTLLRAQGLGLREQVAWRRADLGVVVVAQRAPDARDSVDGVDRVILSLYPAGPPLRCYLGGRRSEPGQRPHRPGPFLPASDLEWPVPVTSELERRLAVPPTLTCRERI